MHPGGRFALLSANDADSHLDSFRMPNKDRPQVERHPPKKGVGWLLNDQQGKVCRFTNDSPTAHTQWVAEETRPLRGGVQPVVRRMLRNNDIEAWEMMLKTGGWKPCQPR